MESEGPEKIRQELLRLDTEALARFMGVTSEVLLRQGPHTKGESGVSENDICECGATRDIHDPSGLILGACGGFSLDRHGVSEPVKVEVCECGHTKERHALPGKSGNRGTVCTAMLCKCPSYRHEPEESITKAKECWIEGSSGGYRPAGHMSCSGWATFVGREALTVELESKGFTIIPNPNEGEEYGKSHAMKALETEASEIPPMEADERAETNPPGGFYVSSTLPSVAIRMMEAAARIVEIRQAFKGYQRFQLDRIIVEIEKSIEKESE